MANTAGVCTSFKAEVLNGYHQFGQPTLSSARSTTTPANDTFKMALYLASAAISAATAVYTATGEVSGGSYAAGGVAVTNANPAVVNSTAGCWTPSASVVFPSATLASFDCALLYNSTQQNVTGRAVAVYTFTAQTITAGVLTLTMPANTIGNALLQIS